MILPFFVLALLGIVIWMLRDFITLQSAAVAVDKNGSKRVGMCFIFISGDEFVKQFF